MTKYVVFACCLLMLAMAAPAWAKTGTYSDCEKDCPRENRPCVGCCVRLFPEKSPAYKQCVDIGDKCIHETPPKGCGGWYVNNACTTACMNTYELCKKDITIDYSYCQKEYPAN